MSASGPSGPLVVLFGMFFYTGHSVYQNACAAVQKFSLSILLVTLDLLLSLLFTHNLLVSQWRFVGVPMMARLL